MGLGRLLEACQVHEKVALEHSSKSTKYELEGSYDDLIHELSWTYYAPVSLSLMLSISAGTNISTRARISNSK